MLYVTSDLRSSEPQQARNRSSHFTGRQFSSDTLQFCRHIKVSLLNKQPLISCPLASVWIELFTLNSQQISLSSAASTWSAWYYILYRTPLSQWESSTITTRAVLHMIHSWTLGQLRTEKRKSRISGWMNSCPSSFYLQPKGNCLRRLESQRTRSQGGRP